MRRGTLCLSAFLLLWLSAVGLGKPALQKYDLESAIAAALARNPARRAVQYDVEAASRDVRRAVFRKYLPDLSFSLDTGVVPGARGDIFYSPDKQTDLDDWGVFTKLNLTLVQPLFTFGQASAAVEGARRWLEVEESKRDLFVEDLSLEVIKAYWSLIAAQQTQSLARQSGDSYAELISEIEKRLVREDSEVDDQDLLEAKSHQIDIEVIKQSSIENKIMAERSFNALLDLDPETEVLISAENPPSFIPKDQVPSGLLSLAESARPELGGLKSAIQALEAKIDLEKSQRWPVLFLAGGFGYAHAGNRTDQKNPFAVDNFNYRTLGAGLGIKWDPNFHLHDVDIQKAQNERRATLARLEALRSQIGLEVSKAYIDARKNDALLKAARVSLQASKTWLRVAQDNWDMGLGDAFRLLRAYQSYFQLRAAEIEREYEFNVSLARLSYVLGDISIYLKWIKAGNVILEP